MQILSRNTMDLSNTHAWTAHLLSRLFQPNYPKPRQWCEMAEYMPSWCQLFNSKQPNNTGTVSQRTCPSLLDQCRHSTDADNTYFVYGTFKSSLHVSHEEVVIHTFSNAMPRLQYHSNVWVNNRATSRTVHPYTGSTVCAHAHRENTNTVQAVSGRNMPQFQTYSPVPCSFATTSLLWREVVYSQH